MKKLLKTMAAVVCVLLLLVVGYTAYVFIAYHRLPDTQELTVTGQSSDAVQVGERHTMVAWNIGFGAYEDDYDFFMDGGTQSWAVSPERLQANLQAMTEVLKGRNADFWLIQEVDYDSTRTYYTDERPFFVEAEPAWESNYAVNFDSPFLLYPFSKPHGFGRSGLLSMSRYDMTSAIRRSLPIDNGVMKIIDLDRCYTVMRFPTDNGRELVVFNIHMTAYAPTGTVADDQLRILLGEMQAEYDAGNYVIAGGDMNKDILGNSSEIFGVSGKDYSWAQPFRTELLEGKDVSLVAPFDPDHPVASCRNPDSAYNPAQFTLTTDGFLVSANVHVETADVLPLAFRYSDHNPVELVFTLAAE